MNVSSAVIQTRGLLKVHGRGEGRVRAVDEVDLDVPPGESLAVMGPSGSGKSTLLHLLGGLERPTGGEVRLDGRRIDTLSERAPARLRRRAVGFVFQAFHVVEELSAAENVELPVLLAGRSRRTARRRADLLLEQVGLTGHARHLPSQLSGGQRQRVAIARALATTAYRPPHRPWLSALLPTPLLLGLRLTARRPGRAVLQACSTATTVIALVALLTQHVQPVRGYGLDGSPALPNLRSEQDQELMLVVTILLVALAVVNTMLMTWTTALEARANMAIARTLGATPGQISAGLSFAQLLPSLPGAVLGLPLGAGLLWLLSARNAVAAPTSWLLAAALATLLVTALPARLAARRTVAATLSAEAA